MARPPISVLSVVTRLLKSIVQVRLSALAEHFGWIHRSQFGFRPGRSTTDVFTRIVQRAHTGFSRGECTVVASLDLAGAYESVPHDTLLDRLRRLGVSGNMLAWIASFVRDRWSRVQWLDAFSDWHSVSCGVPQGSPLSPTLFIL